MTFKNTALDPFYKMDGRESRHYREEDARDLRRNALNELVENTTGHNALKRKNQETLEK